MYTSAEHRIPQAMTDHITEIIAKHSQTPLRNEEMARQVLIENLLIRTYLQTPQLRYSDCLRRIAPLCPHFTPDLAYIRRTAENLELVNPDKRAGLIALVRKLTDEFRQGMCGDKSAFEQAVEHTHSQLRPQQNRILLFALFEYIPALHDSEAYHELLKLGPKYARICFSGIIDSLRYDVRGSHDDMLQQDDPEALRREVYLARRELEEYKALVEAADAEFENKLDEMKQRELAGFFSALNNARYGYLIDTIYLSSRACTELARQGERLPYAVEGIPTLLERLLRFFRDSGITPACRYTPGSVQCLTLAQMDGYLFEAMPDAAPHKENEPISVRVVTSGWRYGDITVAPPILQEIPSSASHRH